MTNLSIRSVARLCHVRWFILSNEDNVLRKQIAGDMLCADQNFDIAQVIRFFRSKVRLATIQMCTEIYWKVGFLVMVEVRSFLSLRSLGS